MQLYSLIILLGLLRFVTFGWSVHYNTSSPFCLFATRTLTTETSIIIVTRSSTPVAGGTCSHCVFTLTIYVHYRVWMLAVYGASRETKPSNHGPIAFRWRTMNAHLQSHNELLRTLTSNTDVTVTAGPNAKHSPLCESNHQRLVSTLMFNRQSVGFHCV